MSEEENPVVPKKEVRHRSRTGSAASSEERVQSTAPSPSPYAPKPQSTEAVSDFDRLTDTTWNTSFPLSGNRQTNTDSFGQARPYSHFNGSTGGAGYYPTPFAAEPSASEPSTTEAVGAAPHSDSLSGKRRRAATVESGSSPSHYATPFGITDEPKDEPKKASFPFSSGKSDHSDAAAHTPYVSGSGSSHYATPFGITDEPKDEPKKAPFPFSSGKSDHPDAAAHTPYVSGSGSSHYATPLGADDEPQKSEPKKASFPFSSGKSDHSDAAAHTPYVSGSGSSHYATPFGADDEPQKSEPKKASFPFSSGKSDHSDAAAHTPYVSGSGSSHYATPFGADDEPQKSEPKKPAFPIRKIGIAICAAVFCVSSFLLIKYFVEVGSAKKASQEVTSLYQADAQDPIETEAPLPAATEAPAVVAQASNDPATKVPEASAASTPQPTENPNAKAIEAYWPTTYPNNPTRRVAASFTQMRAKNKDVIAWMRIENVLEEAVVQRDNTFYLNHDMLGKENKTGALFLDEDCNLDTVPSQFIVYGHNMKEGSMFGSLKKYKLKGAAFYREHPYIEFNTIYENGKYVIFAVVEANVNYGSRSFFPFWYYSRFGSVEDFNAYIASARTLSMLECGVTVEPGDRLLTLSTCTGTSDDTRLIVMARRVRDGENELELQSQIMNSSNK